MKFTVVPIESEECFLAATLATAMMMEEGWPVSENTTSLLEAEMSADIAENRAVVLLAASESGIAGMVELKLTVDPIGGSCYEVLRLFVLPEYRNKGVARLLLAEAAAGIMDEDAVLIINTRGELPKSYQRLGFRPLITTHTASLKDARRALNRRRGI